ncbi:hypothetical protein HU200_000485 [Digitaria exilis]|uniref:Bifunctional inhibitor/plant lipid transfer protein/seed storage helical domain-containing protein n=1 Tax=Digitaria exilis TaxID=1010633 RepID=A0A835FYT5_9POAL|nr:hypothetical protein HU200_000485 [Digitaria exilis]
MVWSPSHRSIQIDHSSSSLLYKKALCLRHKTPTNPTSSSHSHRSARNLKLCQTTHRDMASPTMAHGSSALGLREVAMAVAALLVVVAAPRSCAAQATSGCGASILSLAPCLSFTSGSAAAPTGPCCSALAGVLRGEPRCLCAVLGGGASAFGVTVNSTRALELPGKCKVTTPPVSQCDAVGAPAPSPPATATPGDPGSSSSPSAPAPTAESPTAPPPVHSTTGAGSKATPATGAVSSAAAAVSFVVAIASLMAF